MHNLALVVIFAAAAVVILDGGFSALTARGIGTRHHGMERTQIRAAGVGNLVLGIAILLVAFQLVGIFSWWLLIAQGVIALLGATLILFSLRIGRALSKG